MTAAALLPPPPEEPVLAPEPKLVSCDERRPWPAGLPAVPDVLEAIGAQAQVAGPLRPVHQRVRALFPEYLVDAVKTSLAGSEDPVGVATAQAWRALVASDQLDAALGVDQPALRTLIEEAVDAREKVLAAGYFALDGGAGAEPLTTALAEAIERLVQKAAFKAKPVVAHSKKSTAARATPSVHRVLRWAFGAVLTATAAFHLSALLADDHPSEPWALVGDVDRGRAFLAPAGPGADEASLQKMIADLKAKGLSAEKSPAGEWIVKRTDR